MVYPFIISRRKLVRITADDYPTALNKVLMKYPVKIVTTTYARNLSFKNIKLPSPLPRVKFKIKPFILITMDLISAKVEAAAASKKERKKMYVNTDDEGECTVSSIPSKNKDQIQAVFVNGAEVKLENIEETITTNMETKSKKPAKAKKAVKKVVAAKKSVAVKKVAKNGTPVEVKTGGQQTLSIKEIMKRIKSGEAKAFNKDKKPLPFAYLDKMVNKDKEIIVYFSK